MIAEIFAIVAPLLFCAGIGFAWGRLGKPFDANMTAGLAIQLGVPCLIFSTLTRLDVSVTAFAEMAGAYTLALAALLLVALALTRLLRLDSRAYVPVLTFRNTGNMGLPICMFAFGETGLALAICTFVIASLTGLTLGRAIYAGTGAGDALFRDPIVYAIAVSLLFMIAEIAPPAWLANTAELIGGMTIPLMIISLGVAISQLRVRGYARTLALSAVGLASGFAVGLAVAELFGMTGAARGVLVLQCALPVAIHNYLFAERYNRLPEEVTGMVMMSTLLSFGSLPLVLWLIL